MPSDDPAEHVALLFHGLVSDLQVNDVAQFEERQRAERTARDALRHEQPNHGMNAAELLKKLDGDPATEQDRINREMNRIEKESIAAAAEKDKKNEPLPAGFFPAPPSSER